LGKEKVFISFINYEVGIEFIGESKLDTGNNYNILKQKKSLSNEEVIKAKFYYA